MMLDREESEALRELVNHGLRAMQSKYEGHKLAVAIKVQILINDTYAELFKQEGEKSGTSNQQTGTDIRESDSVVVDNSATANPGRCD